MSFRDRSDLPPTLDQQGEVDTLPLDDGELEEDPAQSSVEFQGPATWAFCRPDDSCSRYIKKARTAGLDQTRRPSVSRHL